jgi:hypothetical protein
MKSIVEVCLIALGLTGALGAQDLKEPALREGIHVDVPVASRAVAMPAADELNATVVTLTTDGKLFLGV